MNIGPRIGQKIGELRNDLGALDAHQDASQRGARRNRGAAMTGGTAVLARAVQVSTSLITIPLTVHYLGNERLGLWMTISSVFDMANFADFGIGNGVLNTVADAFGKNDFDRIRAAISSGFAVLGPPMEKPSRAAISPGCAELSNVRLSWLSVSPRLRR